MSLEEKWQAEVEELETAGTPVEAPEAAMSGAILIRWACCFGLWVDVWLPQENRFPNRSKIGAPVV